MNQLDLGRNTNQPLPKNRFLGLLLRHVDCRTPIIITPEIATALNRERNDLDAYLSYPSPSTSE